MQLLLTFAQEDAAKHNCYMCGDHLTSEAIPLYTCAGTVFACSEYCHDLCRATIERRLFPPN